MSFPHRTAFYDIHTDEIVMPEDAMMLENDFISEVTGKPCSWDEDMGCYNPDTNLVPLASTGLEDSEGNEIFEGHLVKLWETNHVVKWNGHGSFEAKCPDLNCCLDQSEIIGHALTDPELVPDSFDVEGYFELHD